MFKGKVTYFFCSAIASLALSIAFMSASTSFPLLAYQPKIPNSLIEQD